MAVQRKSAGLTDVDFWSRFWSRFRGRPRLEHGERAEPFDEHRTPGGSSVNAISALKLSAVWGCVGLRSATIASLPLHLRGPNKTFATEHPLYRILHDSPNADMSSSEWLEMQVASIDLWGNGYSRIDWEGRNVAALTPIAADQVSVRRRLNGSLVYEVKHGTTTEEISEDNMLHLKGFTLDGIIGLSPIQYAAEAVGGLIDANRAAANEWKNGLRAGSVISTPTLTDDQRNLFKRRLREYEGPENSGKNLLLEKPFEIAGATGSRINPVDAQLLESRYFGIEEICRAFRVPPQLIGHTNKASSWASSLEGMNLGFLTYSLRPTLVRIEQAISRKLLKPEDRGSVRPKFSVEGLLRADTAARQNFYASALQNGYLSRNEVRELEDKPAIDGGDVFTVQLNLTPIDQIGKTPDATPAA